MQRKLIACLLLAAMALTSVPAAGAVDAVTTSAEGAVVLDFETGEFYYEKAADVPRPVACMTKIMSLYLFFEAMEAGRFTAKTLIPISEYARQISWNVEYSGGEQFKKGRSVPAGTLLGLILTASANASVIALAEYIDGSEAAFVARMNDRTAQWGLDAHFADCTGFENEGNAVSPRAMALIAQRLIRDYPQVLDYAKLTSVRFRGRTFKTTNTLLINRTVAGVDGLKTGWTGAAGFCFTGTAQRSGRRIISVVMDAGSSAGRTQEGGKLLEYGFACRWEREAAWSSAQETLQVSLGSAEGCRAVAGGTNRLRATFTGLGFPLPCTVAVEAGQTRLELGSTVLTQGGHLDFDWTTPVGNLAELAVVLTLPDGTQIRRDASMTLEDVLLDGRMGIPRVAVYPGFRVTLPCKVWCEQGVARNVPMAWYLDGQSIPGYSNDHFVLSPEGTSSYTFAPGPDTQPGIHTLELRCNPQGLPGMEQGSIVSATLEVLPLDGAATN